MPAGYTHYCFGKDVYKHLDDQNIKDLLLRNENCFLIGLHGPDIFFYERWNKIARKMHQDKANTFFEKAQDIIQSEAQLAYILGFICHYLLDSQMHPYIKKMIKNTNMDHFEIESDYDRLLLKRHHQDPLHKEIYEHIRFKEKEICTIQSFFPELSYLDIEKALKGLKRIDHLLKAPSFLKRGLIYGCFHLTFNFHKLQGLIINYHHNKEMEKYNDILDKIYQQTLKEALIYLPLYIQNYKNTLLYQNATITTTNSASNDALFFINQNHL